MSKEENRKVYKLLTLALVFITNPTVNIFDYLPDFIGWAIIVFWLGFLSDRAPYFAEAKNGFIKLTIVGIAKIPSYFIMMHARGQNLSDGDVYALFTLIFSVVELILVIPAIKNLFLALAYLGQRTDNADLISPFSIGRDRTKTPDGLKNACYGFAVFKSAATLLPEMLLLTRGVNSSSDLPVFNPASLYPYFIVVSFVSVLILGIRLTKHISRYSSLLNKNGRLYQTADLLLNEYDRKELEIKKRKDHTRMTFYVFLIGSFLTAEIRFDNLHNVNLLPGFIFAVVMLFGISCLSKYVKLPKKIYFIGGFYLSVSTVFYVLKVVFLTRYGYDMLTSSVEARDAYLTIILGEGVGFVGYALFLLFITLSICRYISSNIMITDRDERYSSVDRDYHRVHKGYAFIWCGTGILNGGLRYAYSIIRYFSQLSTVVSPSGELIITKADMYSISLPTMLSYAVFVVISLYFFSKLKDEAIT